ncbi:hypothetical protein ACFXPR_02920 [Nocardia tengchongensis]|uniref:hypothetical protein n=1 Tax=Nocardia tengchongensis TaxID=2055889 RepID=UPI003698FBE2
MDVSIRPPWSNNQLKRLGKAIRDGQEQGFADLNYDDVLFWYNDLATAVRTQIASMSFFGLLGDDLVPRVSSRPKTIDTLRQKLLAHPSWQLPAIIDLAGVRFEAAMNLETQTAVAMKIADLLGQDFDVVASDTRDEPHSGYRALHLRLSFPAGRVEVQVRTVGQGAWANAFEELADLTGRGIRYGERATDAFFEDVREHLIDYSKRVASLERASTVHEQARTSAIDFERRTGRLLFEKRVSERMRVQQAEEEFLEGLHHFNPIERQQAFVEILNELHDLLREWPREGGV